MSSIKINMTVTYYYIVKSPEFRNIFVISLTFVK